MIEYDGYRPGSLADIVGLHARNYATDWGFGVAFEAKVAAELATFAAAIRPGTDLLLCAYRDGQLVGSIVIDAAGVNREGAHLRWFIVEKSKRDQWGSGVREQRFERFRPRLADAVG